MLGVFVVLLLLWADVPAWTFGDTFKLNSTTTAFVGLSILLVTGVLNWKDVLGEKSAWDTLVWFGALVMMATQLNELGVIEWFSGAIQDGIVSTGLAGLHRDIGAGVSVFPLFLCQHHSAHYRNDGRLFGGWP